jgi:hypothetical protein
MHAFKVGAWPTESGRARADTPLLSRQHVGPLGRVVVPGRRRVGPMPVSEHPARLGASRKHGGQPEQDQIHIGSGHLSHHQHISRVRKQSPACPGSGMKGRVHCTCAAPVRTFRHVRASVQSARVGAATPSTGP